MNHSHAFRRPNEAKVLHDTGEPSAVGTLLRDALLRQPLNARNRLAGMVYDRFIPMQEANGIPIMPDGKRYERDMSLRFPTIRGHLLTEDVLTGISQLFGLFANPVALFDQLKIAQAQDFQTFKAHLVKVMQTTTEPYLFFNALTLYCTDGKQNIHDVLHASNEKRNALGYASNSEYFTRYGSRHPHHRPFAIEAHTAEQIIKKLEEALERHPEIEALVKVKKAEFACPDEKDYDREAARLCVAQCVELLSRAFQLSGMNATEFFDLTVQGDAQIAPDFNPTTIKVTARTATARLGKEQWPTPEQFKVMCARFQELSDKDAAGNNRRLEQRWFDLPFLLTKSKSHPALGKPLSRGLAELYPRANQAREWLRAAGPEQDTGRA